MDLETIQFESDNVGVAEFTATEAVDRLERDEPTADGRTDPAMNEA